MTENAPELDLLIIGGGQAGLAMGFHLKKAPLSFRIVERHTRVGDSWRKRYASLVLFTPRSYSALPGLAVPGDPEGYPTKDAMADYLEAYAERFELPVAPGTGIGRLERLDGGFRATTEAGEPIDSRAVVLATGAFQRPAIPPISNGLSDEVAQLAPEDTRTARGGQGAGGRRRGHGEADRAGADRQPRGTAGSRAIPAREPRSDTREERVLVDGQAGGPWGLPRKRYRALPDEGRPLPRQRPGTRQAAAARRGRGWPRDPGRRQEGLLRRREGGGSGRGGVGDRLQGRRRMGAHPRGQG